MLVVFSCNLQIILVAWKVRVQSVGIVRGVTAVIVSSWVMVVVISTVLSARVVEVVVKLKQYK